MKVRLTDICTPRQWKTIPTSELLSEGYPVYGANGLRGYTEEPNFEGEYCVIGRQGALCGNVKYFKGKAYMSDCTRSVNTARAVLTDLGI